MISGRTNAIGRGTRGRWGSLALFLLSTTALAGRPAPALAADTTWTGATGTDWSDAANWDTNAVPTNADDVFIDTVGAFAPEIGISLSAFGANINVGMGADGSLGIIGAGATLTGGNGLDVGFAGNTGTITVSTGGSLVVNGGNTVVGLGANSTGSLTITGLGTAYSGIFMNVGSSGSGALTIADGASATSAGVSIGSLTGSDGTVLVTGANSLWSAAGSPFLVGFEGEGRLTVADGAIVSVDSGNGTATIASQAGSIGEIAIGAASGQAAAASGSLFANTVQFGAGAGAITFNHTGTNQGFSANIAGLGTIDQFAGVTNLTGNSSGFTGTTNVTGGSLLVNNMLGGTVAVTGGALGGFGTLTGALTIGAGGTLAPGNSIGTLSVADIILDAGSTYTVELDDGGFVAGTNNDLIDAAGTATINGGTVHVTPVNGTDTGGTYTPGTYTILMAAGGVTGTFAALTDDYAFLDFVLAYDANNVFLTSSSAVTSFCLAGMSANQCATGDGAFSLGAGGVFTAVQALATGEAPGALDQLSGEIHASARTALIEDSRFPREAAIDRLRNAFEAAGANGAGMAERRVSDTAAFWGRGIGSWGHWDSDGNAARMDRSIGGIILGGDALVSDNARLGLMGGYSRSRLDVDDRASSGTVDTYTLGAYAGGEWGDVSLRGGASHSWHSLATGRAVAFTGFSDSLSASYNARTFQGFGEAAYGIDAGSARLEPFASLAHVNLSTDGFTESGGAAALTASGDVVSATFATLGLRAETVVELGEMDAALRAMAGYRHAFGDTPRATLGFASGGNAFAVAGVPIARDALVLDAGFDLNITENAALGLSYNGQFASGLADQGFKANFAVKF
jgi:outer membrane autotransporter protein